MTKICPVCEERIQNGDKVVAVVESVFVEIPSTKSFAIERPTQCLEIQHFACNDLTPYLESPEVE